MLTHKHLYIYNYVLNIAPNLSLPFNFPLISLFFSYPLLFYRNRYGFNILFYGNLQLFRGWQCVVKSRKCNSAGWARTIDAILRKGKCPPKARRISLISLQNPQNTFPHFFIKWYITYLERSFTYSYQDCAVLKARPSAKSKRNGQLLNSSSSTQICIKSIHVI
jgi:hypothetical protein